MSSMNTMTKTATSAAATAPIKIHGPTRQGTFANNALNPSILAMVSSGGAMTFSIEVTGDDIFAPGYNPATGNWAPMTDMTGLTASTAATLGAAVQAIRARVTAFTSGTLTLQVIQVME